MNKKTVDTYQSLGRFIIEHVYLSFMRRCNGVTDYNDLKNRHAVIDRSQLKKEIEHCINKTLVEKSFAMHKYNHGHMKSSWNHTYRWENVMNFYIGKQIKAQLLDTNLDLVCNDIVLTDKALDKLLSGEKANSFFDTARKILKQKYEEQRIKTK